MCVLPWIFSKKICQVSDIFDICYFCWFVVLLFEFRWNNLSTILSIPTSSKQFNSGENDMMYNCIDLHTYIYDTLTHNTLICLNFDAMVSKRKKNMYEMPSFSYVVVYRQHLYSNSKCKTKIFRNDFCLSFNVSVLIIKCLHLFYVT